MQNYRLKMCTISYDFLKIRLLPKLATDSFKPDATVQAEENWA